MQIMKSVLAVLALTFSLNSFAVTFIGSLLENQQILEFVSKQKDEGYNLTSVLDRLANEGIDEDQRGARGHYLLKFKKIDLVDGEDGDVIRKETSKKYDIRTDFGRVQKIEEIIDRPVEENNDNSSETEGSNNP
jgi:hypothetical protein